ncbi:MAG TPA: hypothetical protein PKN59_05905 [Syntrophales bacterium]|nr:hypothetical protein [Syntrophales bacterium]
MGAQYFALALDDGKRANNGAEATGIALGSCDSGHMMETGLIGIFKFRSGAGISKGDKLSVTTSGWFKGAGSGDYVVGQAYAAVTSGSIGTGLFNFVVPVYAFSSSFVL